MKVGDKVNVYASSSTDSGYGEAIYMGEMDGQPMVKIEETGRILNTRRIIEDGEIIYTVNLKAESVECINKTHITNASKGESLLTVCGICNGLGRDLSNTGVASSCNACSGTGTGTVTVR